MLFNTINEAAVTNNTNVVALLRVYFAKNVIRPNRIFEFSPSIALENLLVNSFKDVVTLHLHYWKSKTISGTILNVESVFGWRSSKLSTIGRFSLPLCILNNNITVIHSLTEFLQFCWVPIKVWSLFFTTVFLFLCDYFELTCARICIRLCISFSF